MANERFTPSSEAAQGGRPSEAGPRDHELGATIRALRLKRKMTIAQLSEQIGVTASLISQVERDISSPSITTLKRVAHALDVPIGHFFHSAGETGQVVRADSRKQIKLPQSSITYELLTPDVQGVLEVIWVEIEPGGETSDQPLSHRGTECTVVVEGEVCLTLGDQTHILRKGDSIYHAGSIPHRTVNLGATKAITISAITPPVF